MTSATETRSFQAETKQLLELMIHSLYTHKEIFLRELISNASDALDKLRFAALTSPELTGDDSRLRIRLEVDPATRAVVIDDNGIGMTRDEVIENLGTIAKSGTKAFSEQLRAAKEKSGAELPELIGQFGVGFYSAFMVAEKVVVETSRPDSTAGVRWTSTGDGEYELEEMEVEGRGTRITLYLRPEPEEKEDGWQDFTQEWTLREVVKRYSDFVEYPIEMDVEREERESEDAEPTKVIKTETLNSMKPLWTRAKESIEPEEYAQFYKHLSHDWNDPLETIHFRAEGTSEYTALLYLPKQKGMDLFDPSRAKSKISLYIKRVFVMSECEELLPPWLRFVAGLVDSADLPLNVSRETLQHNRQIGQIEKRLVRKVLDTFELMLSKDREGYEDFWGHFGGVIKEGLYNDDKHRDAIAKVSLFYSTVGQARVTLGEYVERMKAGQEAIYYISAQDRATAEGSPHLEALRDKGYEVLFLVDHVDEFVVQRFTEFDGKPLKSLDRGEVDLEDEDAKKEREKSQEEFKEVLEAAQKSLDEYVKEVRFSSRLKDSPAVLVTDEHGMSPQLERMLRESGQDVPAQKRILELNASHPVLERLKSLHSETGEAENFDGFLELLYGQALLAEGETPPDPARFAKLVTELLVGK